MYIPARLPIPVPRVVQTGHAPGVTFGTLTLITLSAASVLTSLWGVPTAEVSGHFRGVSVTFNNPDTQITRVFYAGAQPQQLLEQQSLTALPQRGCDISRNASVLRPGVYVLVALPVNTFPGKQSYTARELRPYRIWSQNLYAETAVRRCHQDHLSTAYRIQNGWTALVVDRYETSAGPYTSVLTDPNAQN